MNEILYFATLFCVAFLVTFKTLSLIVMLKHAFNEAKIRNIPYLRVFILSLKTETFRQTLLDDSFYILVMTVLIVMK